MKKNICFKVFVSLIIVVLLFPHITVLAISSEDAGKGIAAWGIAYYNKKQSGDALTIVHPYSFTPDKSCFSTRILDASTRMPKNTYTWNGKTVYVLDCVGWINLCSYNALGKTSTNGDCTNVGEGCYIAPSGESYPGSSNSAVQRFSVSSLSDLRIGDILIGYKPSTGKEAHVALYIGGGELLESWDSDGPRKTTIGSDMKWDGTYKATHVGRFTDTFLSSVTSVNADVDLLAAIGSGSLTMGMGTESEFYFNGVPDGEYSVAGSFWEWIIQALLEIFSFLINIIFYIFRMVFVGFTAIVDNLITYVVKSIAGVEAKFFEDATSGWRKDDANVEKVNIETIIFGEEDPSTGEKNHIFDVNFFKPAPATP